MNTEKMPRMPEPNGSYTNPYDAEQMEAYGRACYFAGLAAAREVIQQSSTTMGDLTSRSIILANIAALGKETK